MNFFVVFRSILFFISISICFPSEIIDVQLNTNVTLTCEFNERKSSIQTDSSHPISLWYKNEREVIGVNNLSNDPKKYSLQQLNDHTYQLILFNVQIDSSGIYKCQNFISEEEKHFQVNLIVPPTGLELRAENEEIYADGRSTMFICTNQQGYPIPIYRWYKNGRLIEQAKGNRSDETGYASSAILMIKFNRNDHQTNLRCQVSNDGGEESVEMKLNIFFPPTISLFWKDQRLNERFFIFENNTGSLRCQIDANPPVDSPLQWYRDDQLLIDATDQELFLNGTNDQSIHQFTCRAKNSLGQSNANVQLEFQYKPRLSMIESLLIPEGHSSILHCSINSNPRCSQVRWFFSEKLLFSQPCPIYNATHTFVEYRLEQISRYQAGKYTCEVHNGNDDDAKSMISTNVHVQYRPVIIDWSNKVAMLENDAIFMECRVDANPRAEIIWTGPHGEELNVFADEKIIKSNQISSELHLPSSHALLHGRYHCRATNRFGQINASLTLLSMSLPDPVDNLQLLNVTDQSFQIQWRPGFDGGSEQTFEILLQNDQIEERRLTKWTQIWWRDLEENTEYQISIRSQNRFGLNENSTNFIVKTTNASINIDQWPIIDQAVYLSDRHQIRLRLKSSFSSLSIDDLCFQYYEIHSLDPILPCFPLKSMSISEDEYQFNDLDPIHLRFQICSIEQANECSRSFSIASDFSSLPSNDWLWIFIGGIIGLCLVIFLLIVCLCYEHRRRYSSSTTNSMDTLKSTSDHLNSISIQVADVYPAMNRSDFLTEKRHYLFPPATSLFSSPSISETDGESSSLQQEIIVSENERNFHWLLSSKESTSSQSLSSSQQGKKLIYQVVV